MLYDNYKTGTSEFLLRDITGHFEACFDGYGHRTESIIGAEVAFKHDSTIPYRVLTLHNKTKHKFHLFEQEKLLVVIEED